MDKASWIKLIIFLTLLGLIAFMLLGCKKSQAEDPQMHPLNPDLKRVKNEFPTVIQMAEPKYTIIDGHQYGHNVLEMRKINNQDYVIVNYIHSGECELCKKKKECN